VYRIGTYRIGTCDHAVFEAWLNNMENTINMRENRTFIFGDFNLPYIDWSVPVPSRSNASATVFIEMMGTFGMT
jgi:hypothetical protein